MGSGIREPIEDGGSADLLDRTPGSGAGQEPPIGDLGTAFSQGGDDRGDLEQFLRDLERLLAYVVGNPDGLVPRELQQDLGLAWAVVQRRFQPAVVALQGVSDAQLDAAGLTGPELAFKLRAVRFAHLRFWREVMSHVPGARSLPAALATDLGLCEVIVGSIPVIKQLLEPIHEFKSVIEQTAEVVAFVVEPE